MRDVQPFSHPFQTTKFNDLRPLHRGNLKITSRVALPLVSKQGHKAQALGSQQVRQIVHSSQSS
jgi:hypothetical protein